MMEKTYRSKYRETVPLKAVRSNEIFADFLASFLKICNFANQT
jgi:hypothetical protein